MDERPGPNWTCPVCDQIIEINEDSTESNDMNDAFNLLPGFANREIHLISPTYNTEDILIIHLNS